MRRGSGDTKVSTKSQTTIFQDGGLRGTRQVIKDVYEVAKKGKHLKITDTLSRGDRSFLPITSSKFLVTKIPCLAIFSPKVQKYDGDFINLYALDGGIISTQVLGCDEETALSKFNFDGWNTLNKINGGYLCDAWYTSIVIRKTCSHYHHSEDCTPRTGGGYIQKEIDSKLTIALPVGISF